MAAGYRKARRIVASLTAAGSVGVAGCSPGRSGPLDAAKARARLDALVAAHPTGWTLQSCPLGDPGELARAAHASAHLPRPQRGTFLVPSLHNTTDVRCEDGHFGPHAFFTVGIPPLGSVPAAVDSPGTTAFRGGTITSYRTVNPLVTADGSRDTECTAFWIDAKHTIAFTLDLDWPHLESAKVCVSGLKATLPSMVNSLAQQ